MIGWYWIPLSFVLGIIVCWKLAFAFVFGILKKPGEGFTVALEKMRFGTLLVLEEKVRDELEKRRGT